MNNHKPPIWLKSEDSDLPSHDIEEAYRLSANSYLVKPASLHGLPGIIKLIKEYWLELNHWALECDSKEKLS